MIKIDVSDTAVQTRTGTSARTGKPYAIRSQTAWAHLFDRNGKPHPHPTRIEINLEDQQQPYAIGQYQLNPASLFADRFSSLAMGRTLLMPVAVSQSTRQAA